MQIETLGPWVLLAVGAVTLLGAGGITWRSPEGRRPLLMWIFGLGACGIGIYGPAFLTPYQSFLAPIFGMKDEPGPQSFDEFFDATGSGELPPAYQHIGAAFALEHPIEGMEGLLDTAILEATDEGGRQVLLQLRTDLQGRKRVVETLRGAVEAGAITNEEVERFDSSTRVLFSTDFDLPRDAVNRVEGLELRREDG